MSILRSPSDDTEARALHRDHRTVAYRAASRLVAGMGDAHLPLSQFRELQRGARQLSLDGTLWLVYELPPSPYDRRLAASLIFESDTVFRRVRTFPANWRDLSDDELFALSWAV